jgi:hypothetical protein
MRRRGWLRLDRTRGAASFTSHFPQRQAAWSRHPNSMRLIEKNVIKIDFLQDGSASGVWLLDLKQFNSGIRGLKYQTLN